jgi:MFS family permease
MDGALVAFILPSATVVFSLSSSQTGLLGSSVLIGYLFGALSAGLLGDLIGRKRVMMYALAIYAAASVVASCLLGTTSSSDTSLGDGEKLRILVPIMMVALPPTVGGETMC